LLSVTSLDITNSVVLASQVYNYKDSGGNYLDTLRRSYDVTDLAGRTAHYRYNDCCGLDYIDDREGIRTYYEYDPLMKRQIGTRTVVDVVGSLDRAIETTNRLDGLGRVLATMRVGTNGNVITQAQFQYDLLGQIIAQTNALNGRTAYTNLITSSGLTLKTNLFPDGGARVEIYNRDGQLAEVIGTAVQQVRYATDVGSNGDFYRRYTQEIRLHADGSDSSETNKTYLDGTGRACKTAYAPRPGVDSAAPSRQSFYNEYGQVWKESDPDGVIMLYTYDGQGRQEYTIAVTDNSSVPTDYDALLSALGTLKGGSNRITQVQWSIVPTNGSKPDLVRQDTLVWDNGQSSGRLVSRSEASADGLHSWQTVYGDNSEAAITEALTQYGTGASRSVMTTAPDLSYTISAYSYGRLTSVTPYASDTSQLGQTTYSYDPHGRQNGVNDARNGTTSYGFNNADQVVSATTPAPGLGAAPQTTTTVYDSSLRAVQTIQPDGGSVTNEFLPNGLLKKTYGSRIYPVGYGYDYAGRVTTMTNWSGFASQSGSRVTTWNYNPYRGWLDSKTYDGNTAGPAYTNTAAGRLQTRLWARGITTTYTYDNAGGLSTVGYNDGTTPGLSYTYDRRGRQATITQGTSATTTLAYNNANQLLSESYSNGILAGLSVSWTYNDSLKRDSLSLGGISGTYSVSYGYEAAGRLQAVNSGANGAVYSYLANSPLVSQIVFTNSGTTRMTTTKQYDYLNRLLSVSSANSQLPSPIYYAYAYNNANQRIRSTRADGSYWLYEYDALGQVRSGRKYWPDQTPVAGQQFEYAHDDIGNRTQTKAGGDERGAGLRYANYYANSLNQYTNRDVPGAVDIMGLSFATNTVTVNGQTAYRKGEYFRRELAVDNSSSARWTNITVAATNQTNVTGNAFLPKTQEHFTYDNDGNLTSDGRWNYAWDAENRLVNVTNNTSFGPQQGLKFDYDGRGRRIHKQVRSQGSAPTNDVKFVYDGWNLLAELNATNNAVIRSFLWGSDLSGTMQGAGGVGGLLEVSYNGTQTTNCFVVFDGNGNVAALADAASTNILAQYEYGPFGEVLRATGPMAKTNPFRFSTKYQDDETDLLYYGFRYYTASSGRWLSKDPIGEQGGNNLYAFTGNDGVNHVDAFGNLTFEGCEGKEEELKQSLKDYCKKVSSSQFKCCLGHFNIPDRLKWRCDNLDDSLHGITIKCEKKDSGLCKGSCGWSLPAPLSDTIHVCPSQWSNPNCGPAGCTLIHELTHITGHWGEKWPTKVEKCLGCGPRTN